MPLNFGDCFAYALAEVSSDVLLYKGDDFTVAWDVSECFSPQRDEQLART